MTIKPILVTGATGKTGSRILSRLKAASRNNKLGDGVMRAIGRQPKDFTDFANAAAWAGEWNAVA